MPKFLKVIWADVKALKNVELYLALLAIVIIYVIDIFEDSIFGVKIEDISLKITLGLLGLLAYELLENRRSQERLESLIEKTTASQSATALFKEWDDAVFREALQTAKSISLLAITNQMFLGRNLELLKQFLSRGGSLRCILIEPEGNAMTMATALTIGYQRQPGHLATQVNLAVAQLRDLAAVAGPDQVQLKFVDFLPQSVLTIVEHQNAEGSMFVTHYGFSQPMETRPSFTLHKSTDRRWFTFYQEAYENFWNWEKSRPIDLTVK